jgi:catechol 2,3-dioxygenase-like lactoylglutathione lyase family enzyme
MAFTEVFAGATVADIEAGRAWYERLFGRPPDLIPNDHEAAWQLTGSGWVYIDGGRDGSGSGLLTLLVDDLDELLAGMLARGLDAGPVETWANGLRRVELSDPDGNTIQLAQPPAREA